MTVQELIDKIQYVNLWIILGIFTGPPVIAFLIGLIHPKYDGNLSPWKYFYAFLVYITSIPGMLACIITAYTMFFMRRDLMAVNIFSYFLPIASMISTLIIVGRNADWEELPGVDRIYSLMIFIGISFGIALAIEKTRIWIIFGGSIKFLLLIALACFILLKWSSYKMLRRKDDDRFGVSSNTRKIEKELERIKKNL